MTTKEPAGPGTWTLDLVHWARPLSTYMGDIYPRVVTEGVRLSCEHYGLPIESMELATYNHFVYTKANMVSFPGPGEPMSESLQQRVARLEEAFEKKIWRDDVSDWNNRIMPGLKARSSGLQGVDPFQLDAVDLQQHLQTCYQLVWDALIIHHRLFGTTAIPASDFLATAGDWTGLGEAELLGLLQGSAPASAGLLNEFTHLKELLLVDSDARALLERARAMAWTSDDEKISFLHSQDQNELHELRREIGELIEAMSRVNN